LGRQWGHEFDERQELIKAGLDGRKGTNEAYVVLVYETPPVERHDDYSGKYRRLPTYIPNAHPLPAEGGLVMNE